MCCVDVVFCVSLHRGIIETMRTRLRVTFEVLKLQNLEE